MLAKQLDILHQLWMVSGLPRFTDIWEQYNYLYVPGDNKDKSAGNNNKI